MYYQANYHCGQLELNLLGKLASKHVLQMSSKEQKSWVVYAPTPVSHGQECFAGGIKCLVLQSQCSAMVRSMVLGGISQYLILYSVCSYYAS